MLVRTLSRISWRDDAKRILLIRCSSVPFFFLVPKLQPQYEHFQFLSATFFFYFHLHFLFSFSETFTEMVFVTWYVPVNQGFFSLIGNVQEICLHCSIFIDRKISEEINICSLNYSCFYSVILLFISIKQDGITLPVFFNTQRSGRFKERKNTVNNISTVFLKSCLKTGYKCTNMKKMKGFVQIFILGKTAVLEFNATQTNETACN